MLYTSSDEAPKSFHLPAGDYVVTIVDATETVSRSTGADMIKLVLDAEAADGSTTTLFDYLVASPSSAWKIDAFRRALGHTVVQGEAVELAAEDLIGRSLRARLRVEEFNGRLSNKIEAWLAPLAEGEPRMIAAPAKSAKEDDANEPF
jgi:hypothetical protein